MSLLIFLKIFAVCLLGAMSPGPSMVVVINNAIFKNRLNGILTSIGHGVGIGIYALFAVLGIALIIKTNLYVFNVIKFLSIIFLVYLGVNLMITDDKLEFDGKDINSGFTSFLQGLSISLLNPKIFIWFVAIYSQFMSVDNDMIFNTILILTASIIDAIWYVILTLLVTTNIALDFIKDKSVLLQKFVGSVFIIIGALLLIELLI
jgi:threonine/homoserine/homoserine lactone efflux protein